MGQKDDQKRICKASIIIDQGLASYLVSLPKERSQLIENQQHDLEPRLLLEFARKIVSEARNHVGQISCY